MYSTVLRSVPEQAVSTAITLVSHAFSVKETTAKAVVESCPIIIIDELTENEAAIMLLAMRQLEALGVEVDITDGSDPELPKIDWPKKPKIFKRSFDHWHYDLQLTVPLGDGRQASLLDLLRAKVTGASDAASSSGLLPQTGFNPGTGSLTPQSGVVPAPPPPQPAQPAQPATGSGAQEFRGSELGEITPFSNPVLPTVDTSTITQAPAPVPQTTSQIAPSPPASSEVGTRMDELFGDEPAVMPSSNDIDDAFASMMDGEVAPAAPAPPPAPAPAAMTPPSDSYRIGSGGMSLMNNSAAGGGGTGGFSVFLAKIADPGRQAKAVPLLCELGSIGEDEAKDLAKKMIIPVLKGVSKEEAEAAKHRFAEIGILARIKAG